MSIWGKIWGILIDLVETLVIALAVFVVIYAFLFRPFQVNGQSMFPNYHNGEYILTNLISLHMSPIKKGEVVVFQAPQDDEKDFIKRVIGIPGDSVKVLDGDVYVNNTLLSEADYLKPDVKTYGGAFLADDETKIVPEGSYFVLGDNRSFSSDSREWGFVPKEKIIGKSFFVYWPVSEARLVKRGEYNIK